MVQAPPTVQAQGRFSPGDKLAFALTSAAAALALAIYLAEKTPLVVVFAVIGFVGFLVYPILHFVRTHRYRVACFALTLIMTGLLGWVGWPPPHPTMPVGKGSVAVLDFNPSAKMISVSNETNSKVFVLSAMISTPLGGNIPEANSFTIDQEIAPHHNVNLEIGGYEPFAPIGPLGIDFKTQVALARTQYPNPYCTPLLYYSPANPTLKMIIDHSPGKFPLPVGDGLGTLTYREVGSDIAGETKFPVKAVLVVKQSCLAKQP
jgi:hypothetical protein